MVHMKRAYEPPSQADGYRVLVERLWPRGMKKEALVLDEWLKDIAPSAELRKWYGHELERWTEFQQRYRHELTREPAHSLFMKLLERARHGTVTLVFASKDEEHNSALLLKQELEKRLRG
ncbi:DUF488 domain-containing protein [Vitiosangium sp. GDMCC 1.1324]|uniref:DUF488 domain-containing protein n=1 Tax=Vitiosangium sp. (strain GDMCC 1.1324) TaxID=2138576 RepID=UPI000D357D2A|nr:DUF488 domain-containing protein [Vitiosangium sp. GDMCC 1.1324]PTL84706.1 DUF488 domain-containing protein [Vitiosangium sp. GDMCC 1.1324]